MKMAVDKPDINPTNPTSGGKAGTRQASHERDDNKGAIYGPIGPQRGERGN